MKEKDEDEKVFAYWGIFVFTQWGISVLNFLILNELYGEDCGLQIAPPTLKRNGTQWHSVNLCLPQKLLDKIYN